MREFQVLDRRHAALCELNGAAGIGRSALCERPVSPACADERDDCEQERKALQTISRPDSCGTHRAIFPSSAQMIDGRPRRLLWSCPSNPSQADTPAH